MLSFDGTYFKWNADKRQQIAKNIIYVCLHGSKSRFYTALKLLADLQGPISYEDLQKKGINLIVY